MLEPEDRHNSDSTPAIDAVSPESSPSTLTEPADGVATRPARKSSPRKAAPRKAPPTGAVAREPAQGEVAQGEVTQGEATQGEPAQGAATQGEAAQGEAIASAATERAPRKSAPRKASARKAATVDAQSAPDVLPLPDLTESVEVGGAAGPAKAVKSTKAAKAAKAVKATKAAKATKAGSPTKAARKAVGSAASDPSADAGLVTTPSNDDTAEATAGRAIPTVLFVAPAEAPAPSVRRSRSRAAKVAPEAEVIAEAVAANLDVEQVAEELDELAEVDADVREAAAEEATGARRRRRRGRRGRGRARDDAAEGDDDESADGETEGADGADESADADDSDSADSADEAGTTGAHRRRRRRRSGGGDGSGANGGPDDPPNTVTHVREQRRNDSGRGDSGRGDSGRGDSGRGDSGRGDSGRDDDGVRGVKGSTRLEAKRQRRRDGRESGRKRPSILSEAEFLARRESVDRVMAVRQRGDRTQIAVLEDDILVEHYVTRASATSYVGNVYLGRVQNVLPSMEAAFVDIGKGRNGVLYAGEVNWDAAGLEGKARAIESALNAGDATLVQVTKDPIGHKGARLTSQISLPGRFLVYVPGGGMTGISRKLPDTERQRLKSILKKIVPDDAGVIIRTAAEGASEEELTHDVTRLKQEWEAIQAKAEQKKSAPVLLHGEPDLAIRVVRDVFNEDFKQLIVEGDDAWETISTYIADVAPDLSERASRYTGDGELFRTLRVDEQLAKALDRKVYLPSGGSLVIDRTEAMTVIDVNTGKYIGSGGNLEQTVTRNNLEAAEEIVRQLRLRDVGGIVVIDFIDMVLESNRDLVLRRLTECLGRDRTKHQVAEVTSLGLVQMTRKRVGEGLLEAFSEPCEVCHGRGVIVHSEPIFGRTVDESEDDAPPRRRASRRDRNATGSNRPADDVEPIDPERRRAAASAMAAIHKATIVDGEEVDEDDLDGRRTAEAAAEGELNGFATSEPDAAAGDDAEVTDSAQTADSIQAIVLIEDVDREQVPEPVLELALDFEPANPVEPAESTGVQPPVSVEAVEAVAPVTRTPRRRRAASRPAGPPVGSAEPRESLESVGPSS